MEVFRNLSIKSKLILIIVTVTTIIIGIGFTITILYDNRTYKNDMAENAKINAQLIGEYCIAPLTFDDKKVARTIIERITTIPYITTICIYDENGNLFTSYQKDYDNDIPTAIPADETDSFVNEFYKIFHPIIYQDTRYGTIYLKATTHLLKAKIYRHLLVVLILMFGMIILSYFIALKLQSSISKPIVHLTHATDKITQNVDYSVRVKKPGNDEIGLLYDSFNELLSRLNTREKERDMAERLLRRSEERIRNINQELEQRVIRRTAQLEATNKDLETFAYSIAHDLRSPLRAIDGFSQILLEEYKKNLDKPGINYLQRIRSAAQHMAQLIDDLLSLSHVRRGEIKIRQVNLSKMVFDIARNMQETEPHRNVEFSIQEGISVNCDEHLLHLVIENLIENAWKFTSKHSESCIKFDIMQKDGETVYYIQDDGVGFDMKFANNLFKIFHRLHEAEEFQGTGIGLATVQRIIHRLGGRVWAEGEVEKGATFYFTLP